MTTTNEERNRDGLAGLFMEVWCVLVPTFTEHVACGLLTIPLLLLSGFGGLIIGDNIRVLSRRHSQRCPRTVACYEVLILPLAVGGGITMVLLIVTLAVGCVVFCPLGAIVYLLAAMTRP